MSYSGTLAQLRKECGLTQPEVAGFMTKRLEKPCTVKTISRWETGVAMPPAEQFLLLCELYEVGDIQTTFRGLAGQYRGFAKLNRLGKSRVEEYITVLAGSPLFADAQDDREDDLTKPRRVVRLYNIPASAGTGSFLDSDDYEDFDVDSIVPVETDFAIKVSGDSMMPRFVDGQIVFIKEQQTLDTGDIGLFALDGDSYIKQLGHGELLSLNRVYRPIQIHEYASFHIFGKVVG